MNLIDRYITEVGKHLPVKSRSDIQAEIKSTLEDMLEDRVRTAGHPADDDLTKEILKEYGPPDKVAASYLPEHYLIGPKLFPIFALVLKIVLTVLTALAIAGFGIRFGMSAHTTQNFMSIFGKTLTEYITGLISAFGNIVFIFAILQWTLPASEFEDESKGKSWDPSDLEKELEPDAIGLWEPGLAIVLTVAALLVFNLYPQIIGLWILDGNNWTFIPALTSTFYRFLPLINLLWVLQIVLNVILLRQSRRTTLTRWFEVGLSLMSIVIAFLLLNGPTLVNLDATALSRVIQDPEPVAILSKLFSLLPIFVLVLVIVLEGIDIFNHLYRLLFKPVNNPLLRIK